MQLLFYFWFRSYRELLQKIQKYMATERLNDIKQK